MSSVDSPFENLKGGVRGAEGLDNDYCAFLFSVWKRVGVPGEKVIGGARPQT